eukprot:4249900-Amphidinium_carterae.3
MAHSGQDGLHPPLPSWLSLGLNGYELALGRRHGRTHQFLARDSWHVDLEEHRAMVTRSLSELTRQQHWHSAVMIDVRRLPEARRHNHVGLHPECLQQLILDPAFDKLFQRGVRAISDAQASGKDAHVLAICNAGSHQSVGMSYLWQVWYQAAYGQLARLEHFCQPLWMRGDRQLCNLPCCTPTCPPHGTHREALMSWLSRVRRGPSPAHARTCSRSSHRGGTARNRDRSRSPRQASPVRSETSCADGGTAELMADIAKLSRQDLVLVYNFVDRLLRYMSVVRCTSAMFASGLVPMCRNSLNPDISPAFIVLGLSFRRACLDLFHWDEDTIAFTMPMCFDFRLDFDLISIGSYEQWGAKGPFQQFHGTLTFYTFDGPCLEENANPSLNASLLPSLDRALRGFWHIRGQSAHLLWALCSAFLLDDMGIGFFCSSGHLSGCFLHLGLVVTSRLFDATLGYPGEGPIGQSCTACGECGHNVRSCSWVWGAARRRAVRDRGQPYPGAGQASVSSSMAVGCDHPVPTPPEQSADVSVEVGARATASDTQGLQYPPTPIPATPAQVRREPWPATATPVRNQRVPATPVEPRALDAEMGEVRGDVQMGSLEGRARVYCPVPGCLHADAQNVAGWSSLAGMRVHLDEHALGRLAGPVPPEFLEAHGLSQCRVCSRLLSRRFGPSCPRCRPSLCAAPVGLDPAHHRPWPDGMPEWDEIFTAKISTRAHVPGGARVY